MPRHVTDATIRYLRSKLEGPEELTRSQLRDMCGLLLDNAESFTGCPIIHGRLSEVSVEHLPGLFTRAQGGGPSSASVSITLHKASSIRFWPNELTAGGECLDVAFLPPLARRGAGAWDS